MGQALIRGRTTGFTYAEGYAADGADTLENCLLKSCCWSNPEASYTVSSANGRLGHETAVLEPSCEDWALVFSDKGHALP